MWRARGWGSDSSPHLLSCEDKTPLTKAELLSACDAASSDALLRSWRFPELGTSVQRPAPPRPQCKFQLNFPARKWGRMSEHFPVELKSVVELCHRYTFRPCLCAMSRSFLLFFCFPSHETVVHLAWKGGVLRLAWALPKSEAGVGGVRGGGGGPRHPNLCLCCQARLPIVSLWDVLE